MSSSSDEELFAIACAFEDEEETNKKRKKRTWVHNINIKRKLYGEFHTLFDDLLRDEAKFFQYFRMTHEKFSNLLNMLRPHIEKNNSTFRESIESTERLALCLR